MKILITGAHFTIAVAVIEELKNYEGVDIVYVGRKNTQEGDKTPSVESKILPEMGIKFIPILTGRLQRALTPYTIPSLFKIPIGMVQAFWIILRERPRVVVSFGGYVGVPVVISAWLLSIPVLIHEQTLVVGMANKISAVFAAKIAVSFPRNVDHNKKIIMTGNPVRREIKEAVYDDLPQEYKDFINRAKRSRKQLVFITGGNQGSHIINLAVEQSLRGLTDIAFVIHQTGDSKFKDYERLEAFKNSSYLVQKFIYKGWGALLKASDLVVSRAGINTLTELAYLGKPALLIPIPYLYQNEQNKNARYFENLGLASILPQGKLNGESLIKAIKEMLGVLPKLKKQSLQAKRVLLPDAASRLALEIVLMAGK